MMSPRRYFPLCLVLMMIVGSAVALIGPQVTRALPEGYPISLSGGYAKEVQGTTTYVDYLQPGDTENYLIRIENNDPLEARHRIMVSGIPEGWLVFLDNGNQNMPVDLDPYEIESVYLYIKNPKIGTADILINVTDEGSDEFWTLNLNIVCQRGPLLVSIEDSSFILGRDVPAICEMKVENIGDVVLNVTLDMGNIIPSDDPIDDTWTVKFSERSFLIPPMATKTITAQVWAPQFEPIGSQKISNIEAKVDGITRPFSSPSLTFRVQTIYDLRASVTPIGYQKVNSGTSVEFDLIIENLASATDYVLISEYITPGGWGVGFNDSVDPSTFSVSIDPESTRRFHPVVFVPQTALAGKHDIIMRASGESNVTDFRLLVEVARNDAVEGIPLESTYRMTLGSNFVTFELKNKGNFFDTVTLEIENRPGWAPFKFRSVQIGGGDAVVAVSGNEMLNISGADPSLFNFEENDLDRIIVSLSPSQTARIMLEADVLMDSQPERGVVGIKYMYGAFNKQSFLQLSLKLVIVDLEILDLDDPPDGLPDLKLTPKPDYDFNERIYFTFKLRNNYPFATREGDVKWRVELAGTILTDGDVGIILPGEEKEFNVSWKADQSTNQRHFAHLRLSGPVYESEDQAPRAKSEDEIFVESGGMERSWGLMILFLGVMVTIIIVFLAFFMIAQKNVKDKEIATRAKYDEVYGGRRRPGLQPGRSKKLSGASREGKSLPQKERLSLPSPKDKAPSHGQKKRSDSDRDKPIEDEKAEKGKEEEIKGPKTAPQLKDLEVPREE